MKQNPLRETGPGISEECIERRHRAFGYTRAPAGEDSSGETPSHAGTWRPQGKHGQHFTVARGMDEIV